MASPSHDLVRQITLISAFSPLTTTSQTSLPTPILGRNCRYFKLEDDLKDSLSESVGRLDPLLNDLGPSKRSLLHRFSPFHHGEPWLPALQTNPLISSAVIAVCRCLGVPSPTVNKRSGRLFRNFNDQVGFHL